MADRTDDIQRIAEERLRDDISRQLEAAIESIERQLTLIKWQQHEDEAAELIDELQGHIGSLEGQLRQVAGGSLAMLMQMKSALPQTIGTTAQAAHAATERASFQLSHHAVEMTHDKIIALQSYHDSQAEAFRSYERKSFNRIEELAAQNGVDIAGIRTVRDRLIAEREEAKKNGDRVGIFKADTLIAYNNVAGLIKTGASEEEISEARRQAEEARKRYLKEREIEALQAGKAEGLSGDELQAHVEQARATASAELEQEIQGNLEDADVTPDQRDKVRAESASHHAKRTGDVNARTTDDPTQTKLTLSEQPGTKRIEADQQAVNAGLVNLKISGAIDLSVDPAPIDIAQTKALEVVKQTAGEITPETDEGKNKEVETPKVAKQTAQVQGSEGVTPRG